MAVALPKQHLEIWNKWSHSQQESKMSFIELGFSEVLLGAEGQTEEKLQPRSVVCHRQLSTCVYLTLGNGTLGLKKFSRSVWVKPVDSGHGPSQTSFYKIQLFRLLFPKAPRWFWAAPPLTAACLRETVTAGAATRKPSQREDCTTGTFSLHTACSGTTATPNGTAASTSSSTKGRAVLWGTGKLALSICPWHTLLAKALRKQASWHVITITALKSSQEHVLLTRKNSPVEKYNVTLQEGPERKKKNQTVMQEPLWHLKRWWHGLEGTRNPKEEVLCTKILQIQNQPDW